MHLSQSNQGWGGTSTITSGSVSAGERDIDLAPALARELVAHKLFSPFSSPDDFVFATETGSRCTTATSRHAASTRPRVGRGSTRRGVQKLSFHDLRHTAISHLIRAGADVAQVQRFAGHAKPSITLDLYVHEFEARKSNDVAERLSAVFAGVV
jgi:integrase